MPAVVQARGRAALSARACRVRGGAALPEGEWVERAGRGPSRRRGAPRRAWRPRGRRRRRPRRISTAPLAARQGRGHAARAREMTAAASAAEAQLTAARDSLAYAVLRAPFAGRWPRASRTWATSWPRRGDRRDRGRRRARAPRHRRAASRRPRCGPALEPGGPGRRPARAAPGRRRAPVLSGDPATHRFEVRADLPGLPACARGCSHACWYPVARPRRDSPCPTAAVFGAAGSPASSWWRTGGRGCAGSRPAPAGRTHRSAGRGRGRRAAS